MLEASLREDNAFVTLTYSDEFLPRTSSGLPTLDRGHLQAFLKRLRAKWDLGRLRFYAVGEYGDVTERPHYHLAVFGLPSCIRKRRSGRCCAACDAVSSAWGMGHVSVDTLLPESAAYVAGYVVKKMTRSDDLRLRGRVPEFARMSLRPGIGADFVDDVASAILRWDDEKSGEVPVALRHGSKLLPLGRYLRTRLKERVGLRSVRKGLRGEMERSRQVEAESRAVDVSEVLRLQEEAAQTGKSVKALAAEKRLGEFFSVQSKELIRKKRGSL